MQGVFNGALKFNQPLNSWDTSKVITMGYMFAFAKEFNQPLNNWNTNQVAQMDSMFNNALMFNQNINTWTPNIIGKPTGFDLSTPAGFINNSTVQPQWK
jgi:surface protein